MPKQVQIHSNERLDVSDLQWGFNTYAQEQQKQLLSRLFSDSYSAVLNGFRVEIPDQGLHPAQITVCGGVAFNHDGQIVESEDDTAKQVSTTLPADGSYYVEVEFTTAASDTDARGFWDPTYDNGTDTSGDALPPGREFSQTVATRVTPDWNIVLPVATTGFTFQTTPSTTRVPVAKVVVASGVVTGVTTTPLRANLLAQISSGVASQKVKLSDSRMMPESGTITLSAGTADTENLTYSANDRTNNTLTLSSTPSKTHPVGRRAVVGGSTPLQYVPPRTTSLIESLPLTGTQDARIRTFQGNTQRGWALGLDPQSVGDVRGDSEITNLKRYVDFLSAQIREMKFGAPTDSGMGVTAPVLSNVSTYNNYFDPVPGIAPSRAITVSVGTGTDSWGDYNVSEYASVQATFEAALTFLINLGGGILFVKNGAYVPTAAITVASMSSVSVTIVGEHRNTMVQKASGDTFSVSQVDLRLENITVGAISLDSLSSLHARDANILALSGSLLGSMYNCTVLSGVDVTSIGGNYMLCGFYNTPSTTSGRAMKIGSSYGARFRDCSFSTSASADYVVEVTTSCSDMVFENCSVTADATNLAGVKLASPTRVYFKRCRFSESHEANGNGILLVSATDCVIEGCKFFFDYTDNKAIQLNTASSGVRIRDCVFTQSSTNTSNSCYGITYTSATNLLVDGCLFTSNDIAISGTTATDTLITNNRFKCTSGQYGRDAIRMIGTGQYTRVRISGNVFDTIFGNVAMLRAIAAVNTSGRPTFTDVEISGNKFVNIGGSGGSRNTTHCVDFTDAGQLSSVHVVNNTFNTIDAATECYAVVVANGTTAGNGVYISGNSFKSIAIDVGGYPRWGAIKASDCNALEINDNLFTYIGTSDSTGSDCGVVLVSNTSDKVGTTIKGNRFNNISSGSVGDACVQVINPGQQVLIQSNEIHVTDNDMYGISVKDVTAGATSHAQVISIANNAIYGGMYIGIVHDSAALTSSFDAWVSITGNTVSGPIAGAVKITGPNTSSMYAKSFSISGNTLKSATSPLYMKRISNASLLGNSISNTNTGSSNYAIYGDSCTNVALTGNTVELAASDSGSTAVTITGTPIMVSGNLILFGTSAVASTGLSLTEGASTDSFVVGNMVIRRNTGTGVAIKNLSDRTRALDNGDNDAPYDYPPSSWSTIGLNWRLTP